MSRALSIDSWLYVRIFFDAVRSCDSSLFGVFCFEEIGQAVQETDLIFEAVTAVGATYANQTQINLSLSAIQKANLVMHCSMFRYNMAAKMREPTALQNSSFLLSLQLLAFMEVC